MSKQNVFTDFANLGDTGADTAGAIQPLTDGERAAATILARPDENLRSRTEILRRLCNELLYYRDFGSRYLIEMAGGGKLRWEYAGMPGRVVNTTLLTLRPFLGPRTNIKGVLTLGTANPDPAANQLRYAVEPTAYATDGMNAITVEHRHVLGTVTPVATVSPGPVYRILVVFDNTNTAHDAGTVMPLVNAAIAGSAGLNGKLAVTASADPLVPIFTTTGEIPINVRTHIAGTSGQATADVETHTIAAGILAGFTETNPLSEGDCIAIRYDYLIEEGDDLDDPKNFIDGGRAEANVARFSDNVSSNLFIVEDRPEWMPGSIPLCKVVNGKLFWCDGTVQESDTEVAPGEALVNSANLAYPGGPAWFDGVTNPATTIVLQITKMLTELGASAGAAKIGIAARSNWALGNGTANTATSIFTAVNKIIQDLAASTGSDLVGAAAQTVGASSVNVGTIYDQVTDLLALLDGLRTDHDALQAEVDTYTLQDAYDASVAAGPSEAVTPITIDADRIFNIHNFFWGQELTMRFGQVPPALEIRAARSAIRVYDNQFPPNTVGFRGPNDADASYDYVFPEGGLPGADALLQTNNAGVMSHRAVTDFALASQFASGSWTPVFSNESGAGIVPGDFTSISGHYIRVGQVVFFSFECLIDTTGWTTGTGQAIDLTLPVAGTISGSVAAATSFGLQTDWDSLFVRNAAGNTAMMIDFITPALLGIGRSLAVSGSYILV